MPTLHWIGKEKVINHHIDVPFKVLDKIYDFGITIDEKGNPVQENVNQKPEIVNRSSGNKIIHGDNLEALKSLLPEYEGKVKCIYIDPPYNTGNESWVYNDNVNDPKIKKWLHSVVGKEGEDLSRHDKWCCMMYPRLQLLHKLLHENGIIIIHIDENAYSFLHLLLIEIFGKNNDLGTVIWDKKNPKGFANKISYQHESILLFSKNHLNVKEDLVRKKKNAIAILKKAEQLFSKIGKTQYPDDLTEVVKKYKLPKNILEANAITVDLEWVNQEFKMWIKKQDFSGGETAYNTIDEKGDVFQTVSMAAPDKPETRSHRPLKHPVSQKDCPVPQKGWRFPDTTMDEMLKSNQIIFGQDETTQPRRKYLLKENMFESISSIIRYGGSDEKFQTEIGIKLENPKPFVFANEILSYFTKEDDIILDSFAGSGTTGHSVLNLNKEDKQNRKFILVEMMDYAEKTTAERIRRAIKGFGETKGTGGSFDFYTLGQPLFLDNGNLNEIVGIEKIRQYVFYTETKKPLTETKHKDNKHFLGKFNDTGYYFNYEQDEVTTLDHAFLATMKTKAEQYVTYADNCLLTKDFMTKHHIIFKKIPRDITRF